MKPLPTWLCAACKFKFCEKLEFQKIIAGFYCFTFFFAFSQFHAVLRTNIDLFFSKPKTSKHGLQKTRKTLFEILKKRAEKERREMQNLQKLFNLTYFYSYTHTRIFMQLERTESFQFYQILQIDTLQLFWYKVLLKYLQEI